MNNFEFIEKYRELQDKIDKILKEFIYDYVTCQIYRLCFDDYYKCIVIECRPGDSIYADCNENENSINRYKLPYEVLDLTVEESLNYIRINNWCV